MKHLFIALSMLALSSPAFAQTEQLRKQIENIIQSQKVDVGISIIALEDGDTLSVNGNKRYTIMSVVKFPQALFILHRVDEKMYTTNQVIHFAKEDLNPDTHSPLRDEHPAGSCDITLKEALSYAVSTSDNNVCDKLFALSGGPQVIEQYIHSLGIKNIGIGTNYAHMAQNTIKANWSTPNAMAQLLRQFYSGKILSDSSRMLLWNDMVKSKNSDDRLKGLLPENAVVAHKSGTMYSDAPVLQAINDVGIVSLPNGKHYAIVVFTNNSSETPENTKKIIARVNKAAWDYFTGKKY